MAGVDRQRADRRSSAISFAPQYIRHRVGDGEGEAAVLAKPDAPVLRWGMDISSRCSGRSRSRTRLAARGWRDKLARWRARRARGSCRWRRTFPASARPPTLYDRREEMILPLPRTGIFRRRPLNPFHGASSSNIAELVFPMRRDGEGQLPAGEVFQFTVKTLICRRSAGMTDNKKSHEGWQRFVGVLGEIGNTIPRVGARRSRVQRRPFPSNDPVRPATS